MIRRAVLLVFALSVWSCSDRSSRLPEYELAGATMGTRFSVKLVAPDEAIDKDKLQQQLVQTLARIEERMSTFVADSELSRFNASSSTGWIAVSDELCSIVESAIEVSQLTGGAFDVTVGPLVNLWGFGPDGSATEPSVPDPFGGDDQVYETAFLTLEAYVRGVLQRLASQEGDI